MADTYYILLSGLESSARDFALQQLAEAGHRVVAAESLDDSGDYLEDPALDVVYLQPSDEAKAVEDLERVGRIRRGCPTVLVCRHLTTESILNAWHAGAVDLVFLPLTAKSLRGSLDRAAKRLPLRDIDESKDVQARLRYLDENGEERTIAVIPPRFTIGRKSDNDLVMQKLNISRSHAEILAEGDNYTIHDLGSKHGSYVNGMRIDQTVLKHGDRIQLGGLQGQSMTFLRGDLLQSLFSNTTSKPETALSVRGFREMAMLISTFRALSSISLLDDLLNLVVDTAIELTGAERGFIMLKEPDDTLSFRCARNAYKESLDGSSFQTSRRVPDEAFRTGKRIVITDLDYGDGSEEHYSTRRLGLRSISCVPLRYIAYQDSGSQSVIQRTENIGVLYVDSQSKAEGMTKTQLDALDTLASEAAMAIYNARLYRDSQEKRRLEEELAIAREIQQALLPQPNKVLPFVSAFSRNLPCREVGGDYFDYFDMKDGGLGFALGDVSGKGTPAALLASVLQGIFSAQTLLDLPLPQMMANVNSHLVKRGTGNRFVTFFFGSLDPHGNCAYTNAGHNPPLLLRRDGTMEELTEGGMVLGLFEGAQFKSDTVKLGPGDHLVLFTDGVLEAHNTEGEEFGEERLRTLLKEKAGASAPLILESLQQAITLFSADAPQHDDITMMILGFKEQL